MSAHQDERALRGHAPRAVCVMCDCPVNPSELHERGAIDRHTLGGIAVHMCPDCYKHATDRLVRYCGPTEDPLDDDRDTLPAPAPIPLPVGGVSWARCSCKCDARGDLLVDPKCAYHAGGMP